MRAFVLALAALAGASFIGPARAVDTVDHFNVQEPRPPLYRETPPSGSFKLPPVAPPPQTAPDGASAKQRLRWVVFEGNTALPEAELASVAAPYLERELGEGDLEALRQALTRHYIERGYVNSGALLGGVKDAVLTVRIVEGRLSEMRIAGLGRLDEDYVVRRLVRDEGAVLNADQLRERFLLLLEDPLFERINARLLPGRQPGEAILDLNVQRARPYQLSLFANNYRPPSIGSESVGITGWLRDATGRGDLIEATWQESTESVPSRRYSLGWRFPLTYAGTQLSVQIDHGRSSVIEEPLGVLDIKSTLDSRDVGLSQLLYETLSHKFSLGANYVLRENRTTLLGRPFAFAAGEPDGVIKVRAWRLWQEYSFRTETQALALRATLTTAHNNLEDPAGLPGITTLVPDRDYRIWLGQFQYARRVMDNGAQIVLRGSSQGTSANLPAIDRMAIGGVYTVRGFRENQLIRDKGAAASLEFDFPVLRGDGASLNLIPFYDWGRGRNQGENAAILSSAGLAARARWQGFSLDLALAWRLQRPNSVQGGSNLQDDGVHVQLSYNFF